MNHWNGAPTMKSHYTTQKVGISLATDALKFYFDGNEQSAIPILKDILQKEPENWYVHLMLGACYYRTGDIDAARREFQSIYQLCPNVEIVRLSVEAFRATNSEKMPEPLDLPPEFGCYAGWNPSRKIIGWLDMNVIEAYDKFLSRRKGGWSANFTGQLQRCFDSAHPNRMQPRYQN
jgi:hypothetical protein